MEGGVEGKEEKEESGREPREGLDGGGGTEGCDSSGNDAAVLVFTVAVLQVLRSAPLEPMLFLKMVAEGNFGVVADTLEQGRLCRVNLNFSEAECASWITDENLTHVKVCWEGKGCVWGGKGARVCRWLWVPTLPFSVLLKTAGVGEAAGVAVVVVEVDSPVSFPDGGTAGAESV